MPNYVTNVVKLDGTPERIQALRQAIMNDALGIHHIDFQKIIPMPGHIFAGPVGTREREIYGKNNWYDWSIENWGTKRNAVANEVGIDQRKLDEIRFYSENTAPHPIIAKLSEMYPDIKMEHCWADENLGYNCGQRTYKAGEFDTDYQPGFSRESQEFAADVMGFDLADRGMVLNEDGTEYIDPELSDDISICGM